MHPSSFAVLNQWVLNVRIARQSRLTNHALVLDIVLSGCLIMLFLAILMRVFEFDTQLWGFLRLVRQSTGVVMRSMTLRVVTHLGFRFLVQVNYRVLMNNGFLKLTLFFLEEFLII
jgi:hypothetical protein